MQNRQSLIASAVASALFASCSAYAQQAVKKQEEITVTASPLGRSETEMAQPASVLTDEDLRRKRAASIGDTLSQEPGVQSSAFGPGAGRPIIRGLDGARIRVLENGIGTLDVSSVSPDHMVATESLHADQIEILRGPASLLYGSGAIGGIVNVVSNLIPRNPVTGLSGNLEGRLGSANRERTGAFNIDDGNGSFAWHVDAFQRKTDDYKIPGHVVKDDPDSPSGTLPDTAIDTHGAGLGGSWTGNRGYLGAGIESLTNTYGVPTGEGSHIHLHQTRTEASGELSDPLPGFERFKFRLGHGAYQHEEIEATGAVATTFKNNANESRFELAHLPIWDIKGTFGLQLQDRELSALGAEALFPKTRSKATGVFLVEQKDFGVFAVDGGLRWERETRRPSVDPADIDKFAGAVNRDFDLVTPAVGLVWKFAPEYRFSIAATQAQRAPSVEELFSNGIHGATATFELGNPALRKEVSRNLDVTLRKATGDMRWRLNAYANRIKDYVYAASVDANGDGVADRVNGENEPDPAGEFLVQHYSQADARFRGFEAEWSYKPEAGTYGVRLFGDLVRATLADGSNLPRIAPARLGAEVEKRWGVWGAHLTAIHSFAQKRTAALETPSDAYTRLDGEITWQLERANGRTFIVFLQGSNLLDEDIRLHTSYLKDIAPLMGRSFTLGLRAEF